MLVLANKIDDPRQDALALEFHRLGLGDPIPLSALHGHGTGDLLDAIVDRSSARRASGPQEVGEEAIRVAILGRPNVGKSSLLNALLGEERVIVSEVPGHDARRDRHGARSAATARSCSSTPPGIRRKRRQRQGIEYYSELRALEAAERADVALVLIDASEGLVDQDLSVADVARKAQCSTLVVLSKWDVSDDRSRTSARSSSRRLRQRPPVVAVSAKTGRGIDAPARPVERALREARRAHPAPRAEPLPRRAARAAAAAVAERQAPQPPLRHAGRRRGRRASASSSTTRRLITRDYGYWVENQLRERFELAGRAGLDRLRPPLVNVVVVGGGSWGTAFARVLAERGHDVTLACRDPEQARAIAETGRNPRYLHERRPERDRARRPSTTRRSRMPSSSSLAVPSRAFADVVRGAARRARRC